MLTASMLDAQLKRMKEEPTEIQPRRIVLSPTEYDQWVNKDPKSLYYRFMGDIDKWR